ncbi:hypothetical protein [Streptomyces sp. NBC_01236]|uniref:hypothetical protein n=1 Tax=Streptomyces sp. NBC_01236 TaxID=2903789 RepID=UPI002E0D7CBB|nr:hypothetical protein OG324_38860 [Streptomyces sp. NBC_01236]
MSGNVDQDAVLQARNVLLSSARPTRRQEAEAYRVLAKVSPASYAPKLANALMHLSFDDSVRELPQARLDLCQEAVDAARQLDVSDPRHAEVLLDALKWYQRRLFELGRRPEALTVGAEMAGISRRTFDTDPDAPLWTGLTLWARCLAEEGRHGEAAELLEEFVRHSRPGGAQSGGYVWELIAWCAEAEAAGLQDMALTAAGELVELERGQLALGQCSLASLLLALLRQAELYDGYGHRDAASATLDEATTLLAELAANGEPKIWSGSQYTYWVLLFGLSGRADELPAPGRPAPALGAYAREWAPDIQERHFAELPALREAVERAEDPADRVTAHRKLTIRTTLHSELRRGHRFLEPVLPLFDEGVSLTRRLGEEARSARALFDRASALTAGHRYADAYADFQEARKLRNSCDMREVRALPASRDPQR